MHRVERHLGDISIRCNSKLQERSAVNSCRLMSSKSTRKASELFFAVFVDIDRFQPLGHQGYANASQLSILQNCPNVIKRLLKKDGSILLAAKVLIISRLLHKTLASHHATPFVEETRIRLGKLRQRLLSSIDRRLAAVSLAVPDLIEAMCAYSLATSSSSADILRHFHRTRSEAISTMLDRSEFDSPAALQSLKLWILTLESTQSIFSRQLSNALLKLKATPLLNDPAIQGIMEFDLDIHGSWIGDDINNFVPYVRHDDLPVSAASQQLSSWAPTALETLLLGIANMLDTTTDMQVVVNARQSLLQLWFSESGNVVGISKSAVLEGLRQVFIARLTNLVRAQGEAVGEVRNGITQRLHTWNSIGKDNERPTIWDRSTVFVDISSGAGKVTKILREGFYGNTEAVRQATEMYQNWLRSTNGMSEAIDALKNAKWDDVDFEPDVEEEDAEDILEVLRKDDPSILAKEMQDSLLQGFQALQDFVGKTTEHIHSGEHSGAKAAYILRILREIKENLPKPVRNRQLAFSSISTLHEAIAKPVVRALIADHEESIKKAIHRRNVRGKATWDGTPALPVLPSPWTFRFFRALSLALTDIGPDIWTTDAMRELKSLLRQALESIFLASSEGEHENGTKEDTFQAPGEENPTTEDASRIAANDRGLQQVFDLQYLEAATMDGANQDDGLVKFRQRIEKEHDMPAGSAERLRTSSAEYWKRTWLLFGLLK